MKIQRPAPGPGLWIIQGNPIRVSEDEPDPGFLKDLGRRDGGLLPGGADVILRR